jgi:hypothetical protein
MLGFVGRGTIPRSDTPMSTTTRGRIQDALNVLLDVAKLLVEP